DVRIRDGLPEFLPPAWIDPTRAPRRQPSVVDIPVQRQNVPPAAEADRRSGVRIANLDGLFSTSVS
ncbi:MAG: hypothetical protein ABW212_19035, partial [Pseudonocardia sediminis]